MITLNDSDAKEAQLTIQQAIVVIDAGRRRIARENNRGILDCEDGRTAQAMIDELTALQAKLQAAQQGVVVFNVAREFSETPSGLSCLDGPDNARLFRIRLAELLHTHETVVLELDGVADYSVAFVKSVFGGLVSLDGFTSEQLAEKLHLRSKNASLLSQIYSHFTHAEKKELMRDFTENAERIVKSLKSRNDDSKLVYIAIIPNDFAGYDLEVEVVPEAEIGATISLADIELSDARTYADRLDVELTRQGFEVCKTREEFMTRYAEQNE